jgi:uncharacterized protein YuzE
MVMLKEALPFLVIDLESALVHLGRGSLAVQLREVAIERWTYDEHSDVAYLQLRSPHAPEVAEEPGETVSVFDEAGVNLDTDAQGRLTGMEILAGGAFLAQLKEV